MIRSVHLMALAMMGAFTSQNTYGQATKTEGPLGQRAYKAVCMGCHSVEPGVTKVGPSLFGTMGRGAGSPNGSEALRKSSIVWDRETLNRYLRDPQRLVPGTTMVVKMEDSEVREAVVDFIAGLN